MIYVKENESVKKYKIEVNKEKLNNLKYMIIKNCSVIEHIKQMVREDYLPFHDGIYIRNYWQKFIRRDANSDFFGPTFINIYEVEYDYYNEPSIVKIINKVVEGDEEASMELLNYNKPSKKDYKAEVNKLLEDKDNIEKNIQKINELIQEEKYNKDQKDISFYLSDVKSCISLILVDECSYEDYLRFCKFIDTNEKLLSNSDLIQQYCLQRP